MAAGLAERERLRDLFGRHVGTSVAQRGAAPTASPSAARCARSPRCSSTSPAPPRWCAAPAPRRWSACSTASSRWWSMTVEAEGGLVNKFEGDAALCVFGAPAEHADPAGAALRAARRIGDGVRDGRRGRRRRRGLLRAGVGRPGRRRQPAGVHGDRRPGERGRPAHRAGQGAPLPRRRQRGRPSRRPRRTPSGRTGSPTPRSGCAGATRSPAPGCAPLGDRGALLRRPPAAQGGHADGERQVAPRLSAPPITALAPGLVAEATTPARKLPIAGPPAPTTDSAALTRPRNRSGVAVCTSAVRKTTLSTSATPASTSQPRVARQGLREPEPDQRPTPDGGGDEHRPAQRAGVRDPAGERRRRGSRRPPARR